MRWIVILLFATLPSGAFGLSCLPPNAARSLDHAMRSGASVHAVAGTLALEHAGAVSATGTNQQGVYRLRGTELNRGGWLTELDVELRVETRCVASWCGEAPAAKTRGLFLLTADLMGNLVLRVGPCGGTIFPPPTEGQSKALQRCAQAGRCNEEDVLLFEAR